MAPNNDRNSPGFWLKFFNSFRIAWRLMWDGRVPMGAKLIPIFTILYILSPIDIIPDFIVGLGQLDDLALFLLGVQLFIAVSPKEIVERIRAEIDGVPPSGDWTVTGNRPNEADQSSQSSASRKIIDG